MSPSGEPAQNLLARRPALAAGEDGDADAGRFGERRDGRKMLAGENFGRRHECGLAARFDDRSRSSKRDHRLARPDVALQQPQHPLRTGKIGGDVVNRLLLRMGERVRQRPKDAGAQAAFAGRAATRLAPHMRAHECERELACEQLVVGKPRPCWILRSNIVRLDRPVQLTQRGRKSREAARAPPRLRPAIPIDPAADQARRPSRGGCCRAPVPR